MKAVDFRTTEEVLAGWPVRVTSYVIADVFHCHVDNVSPGAVIARASDPDRATAEAMAREKATCRLAQTRRRD